MRPLANSFISVEIISSRLKHWWKATPEVDTGVYAVHSSNEFATREEAIADWTHVAEANRWEPWTVVPARYEVKRICRDCKSILSVATATSPDVVEVPCERGCQE